jgi:hypothetical protein
VLGGRLFTAKAVKEEDQVQLRRLVLDDEVENCADCEFEDITEEEEALSEEAISGRRTNNPD